MVGFWGLSVAEMPHRLRADGGILYAWCAWDTLFLPIALGEQVEVESICPTTAQPITLTVAPEGVSDVHPPGARMSFLLPGEEGFSGDVIRGFCTSSTSSLRRRGSRMERRTPGHVSALDRGWLRARPVLGRAGFWGQPLTRDVDTIDIAERLACCAEERDETDRPVQLGLFRLLAEGEPVEPTCLAAHVGLERSDVIDRLARWHGVHADDEARIVAFQGLPVVETPHRLRVDGRTLYAWCAWDTLVLPELIGRPAEIGSTCPTTGETISLRVGPEGPTDVSPRETVLSFLLPGSRFGDDTIASSCAFIHYLSSPQAAEEWTAERPGTSVISIEDGLDIGRRTNAARWGSPARSR